MVNCDSKDFESLDEIEYYILFSNNSFSFPLTPGHYLFVPRQLCPHQRVNIRCFSIEETLRLVGTKDSLIPVDNLRMCFHPAIKESAGTRALPLMVMSNHLLG